MSSIQSIMGQIMESAPAEIEAFAKLPKAEQLRILIEENNAEVDEEGYEKIPCDICHGKGKVYSLSDDGQWWQTSPCKCAKSRKALDYVERMGLTELLKASTFDKFVTDNDFTAKIKGLVEDYVKTFTMRPSNNEWLYIGGQSGCGKTHLAMAVFGKLIHLHKAPRVMLWIQDSQRIKALVTDEQEYSREVHPLQTAEYLVIDDFFNTVPTVADIKLARTILDYRYVNSLPTIITSELLIGELYAYDDALASRIVEKCGKHCIQIGQDIEKNYRMRGLQVI